MLITLGEQSIKALKDFAELSSDELIGAYDEKKRKKNQNSRIFRRFCSF